MAGFAKYERSEVQLSAWKALTPAAREVYMRLKLRCFAEGKRLNNNGSVFRSPRDLAKDTGLSVKSVSAGLADLQAKGWIIATGAWSLGLDGKGRTATWRLTMLASGAKPPFKPPTREPERWSEGYDFPVPVYGSYRPKPRKARIKNVTPNPNRAHHRAPIGRTHEAELPENVVEVRPNRKHGGGQ
ncbi:hypothetical protein GQ651_09310 [Alphaproteobacteria bacterium GH1-50]|uniref:Helix-turn-helix domain-containing protein n=1 Tax=Kangsaoukella pontilimi TaxID=2691042 RepID=A0A7C9MW07_9RHOB|nr:hypothetical protein [Kangsaoukella pontilimi]